MQSNSNFYYYFLEFKLRALYIVFSFMITFIISYHYYFEIIYIFTKPLLHYKKTFIFTDLTEAFYTSLEIAFFLSFYLLIPLFIYELWCFFVPSKFFSERKKLNFKILFMFSFFIISILFVYIVLLPKLYNFLLNFKLNTNLVNIDLQARIQSYTHLVCKIFIMSTFFFQLPTCFFLLIELKVVKLEFLAKNRIKIFFIVLIISSLLSPPDIFIQITTSFVFQFLVEFLFIFSFFFKKLNG